MQGNIDSPKQMATSNSNPKVQFFEVKGGNHFNILVPLNRLLAQKILQDNGRACNITLSDEEIRKVIGK